MSIFYVSSGGDDSDGLTWATAFNTIQQGISATSGTSDDIVFIDDENWLLTAALVTSSASKTSGSITLRSRSGDPDLASIRNDYATLLLIDHGESCDLIVQDIKLKESGGVIFWRDQHLTLKNVILDQIVAVGDGGGAGALKGLLSNYHGTNPADLTVETLTVTNCSITWTNGTAYEGALWSTNRFGGNCTVSNLTVDGFTITTDSTYQFNGMCFHRGQNNWSGTNTFRNITMNHDHDSYGLIKMENGFTQKFSGNMYFENVNVTITGVRSYFGHINVSGADTLELTFDDFECKDGTTTSSSGSSFGVIGQLAAATTIILRPTSVGSISIHDNTADKGVGWIHVVGIAHLTGLKMYNNSANYGGAIWHGPPSTGTSLYLSGSLIYNNTATTNGGGLYGNGVSGTTYAYIDNVTFAGNSCVAASGGDGAYFGENTGITNINNLTNCIFWNQADNDEINSGGTAAPEINLDYCCVRGGAAAVTGETAYTNEVDSDPLFKSATNFELQLASPMRSAGTTRRNLWDYKHRAYRRDTPTIGGWEFANQQVASARTPKSL